MGDPDKILLNEGVDLCQFKGPRCEKSLGATVLENYLEDYFSLWKAVIFFKKRTKCSVSTTVFLLRVAAEAEQKLPQYWTKVRQNKSVITETNSFFFFYCPVSPFFLAPGKSYVGCLQERLIIGERGRVRTIPIHQLYQRCP